MKIKTSEATPLQLNFLVAKCEGYEPVFNPMFNSVICYGWYDSPIGHTIKKYSTDWSQGGPIIERERIQIFPHNGASEWCGVIHVPRDGYTGILIQDGPTPLIAAMRCYVASRLSDEVDVPDELV